MKYLKARYILWHRQCQTYALLLLQKSNCMRQSTNRLFVHFAFLSHKQGCYCLKTMFGISFLRSFSRNYRLFNPSRRSKSILILTSDITIIIISVVRVPHRQFTITMQLRMTSKQVLNEVNCEEAGTLEYVTITPFAVIQHRNATQIQTTRSTE